MTKNKVPEPGESSYGRFIPFSPGVQLEDLPSKKEVDEANKIVSIAMHNAMSGEGDTVIAKTCVRCQKTWQSPSHPLAHDSSICPACRLLSPETFSEQNTHHLRLYGGREALTMSEHSRYSPPGQFAPPNKHHPEFHVFDLRMASMPPAERNCAVHMEDGSVVMMTQGDARRHMRESLQEAIANDPQTRTRAAQTKAVNPIHNLRHLGGAGAKAYIGNAFSPSTQQPYRYQSDGEIRETFAQKRRERNPISRIYTAIKTIVLNLFKR